LSPSAKLVFNLEVKRKAEEKDLAAA